MLVFQVLTPRSRATEPQVVLDQTVSSVSQPSFPITVCMPYAHRPGEVSLKGEMASTFKSTVEYFLTFFGNDHNMLEGGIHNASKIAEELYNSATSGQKPNFGQFEQQLIHSIVTYIYSQNPDGFELAGSASMEKTPQYAPLSKYDTYESYKDSNFQIAQKRAEAAAAGLAALFKSAGVPVPAGYFHLSSRAVDINPDAMYRFLSGEEVSLPDGRRVRLPAERPPIVKDMVKELDELLELDPDAPNTHRVRPERIQEYNQFLSSHKLENPFLDLFRGVSFEQKARCELLLSSSSKTRSSDGVISAPLSMALRIGSDTIALTSSAHASNARLLAWLEDAKGNKIADVPVERPADDNSPAYARLSIPSSGKYSLVVQSEYVGPNNTVLFQTPPMRIAVSKPALNISRIMREGTAFTNPGIHPGDKIRKVDMNFPPMPAQVAPVFPYMHQPDVAFQTSRFLPTLASFGGFRIPLANTADTRKFQSVFAEGWYAQTTGANASGFGKQILSMLDVSQMPADYFKFKNGGANAGELAGLRKSFSDRLAGGDIRGAAGLLEADHLERMLSEIVGNSQVVFRNAQILKYRFSASLSNQQALQAFYRSLAGLPPDALFYVQGMGIEYDTYGPSAQAYSEDPYRKTKRSVSTRAADWSSAGANVSLLLPLSAFPIVFGLDARYGAGHGTQDGSIPSQSIPEYGITLENPGNSVKLLPLDLSRFSLRLSPFSAPNLDVQVNTKPLEFSSSTWHSKELLGVYAGYKGWTGPDAYGRPKMQNYGLLSLFGETDNNALTSSFSGRADLSLLVNEKLKPACVGLDFTSTLGAAQVSLSLKKMFSQSEFFTPSPSSASLGVKYNW